MNALAHVSLFSGIDGIGLAMERAGVPTVLRCEFDKAAAGVLADRFSIEHGPLAAIASIPLVYAGYGIVGLFVVAWVVALAVWRFGNIEERWSEDLV